MHATEFLIRYRRVVACAGPNLPIYRPIYQSIWSVLIFFFCIFSQAVFYNRCCVGYIDHLPIYRRYITDIERVFSIFPINDFRLQKSCREGSTPEISTIYHRYFAIFRSVPPCDFDDDSDSPRSTSLYLFIRYLRNDKSNTLSIFMFSGSI